MNEKTQWFYTEFKADTQAVILLAHGLNLRPSKMDQLTEFFNLKKCDVLRISIGNNPNNWKENFNRDYEAALEHAEVIERPLYFVGFSLGALLGIHYLLKHPYHQFKKLALIAPATHTHFYTIFPALLGKFFPFMNLPSFNLENYRSKNSTSLNEYQQMRKLQMEIKDSLKTNQINLPTLLITNPKDELVNSSKLTKFAHSNPYWKCLNISNQKSQLPRKYHHLMIDREAMGLEEWEKLLKNLTAHFSL